MYPCISVRYPTIHRNAKTSDDNYPVFVHIMWFPEACRYVEFVVSQEAPALRGRVVRFYQEDRWLEHSSYLPHTFYLENDEPADTLADKHTRFSKKHFTPAYDGIIDDDVTEGVEFVVVETGEFHGRRFCMRTCASPRKVYRVWAQGECTDWRWRQFNLSRDQVAPFHAPFVTGNAVPPSVVRLKRGGESMLVVMKHYNRMSGTCSYFYSVQLATLIRRGILHAATHGEESAIQALRVAVESTALVTGQLSWYEALDAYEPHTMQWGKIGRLYGLKGEKARLNGEIVAVNRLWADEDTTVQAECTFLNEALLSPVDVPEGHVASAEFVQTPAKLRLHLEMPLSVHTMVGMIAKTTFYYIDDAGQVASLVRIRETPDGGVVCDRKSLEKALIAVGRKDAEWWQEKLLECLHAMAHNEEAYGNDPNRVTLTLRAVRGLAEHCWRSKYETKTPETPEVETTPRDDDWCTAVCKCTKQRKHRRGKPRRKGKKGKKKA